MVARDTGLIFKYPRAIIPESVEHYNHDRGHISGQMDPSPTWTLTDEESRDGIGTKYFNIMWVEENSL